MLYEKIWQTASIHFFNQGEVEHVDWHDNYVKMRSAAGIEFPGYMIHEALNWSEDQSCWMALPRRASKYKYNDVDDERHGTNMLIKVGLTQVIH